MSEVKHTPTPWKADLDLITRNNGEMIADASFGEGSSRDEDFANAAHIVKCVNMHDELLKVIRIIGVYSDDHFIRQSCQEALKKAGAL